MKMEKRREHVHKMAQLSTVRLFLKLECLKKGFSEGTLDKTMCLVFGYKYKKLLNKTKNTKKKRKT